MWTRLVCSIDAQKTEGGCIKTISETRPSNVTPFVLEGRWALHGLDRPPSLRCASAIQIVRPLESIAEIQPQLHPALLRLSGMVSQYFTQSSRFSNYVDSFCCWAE